MPLQKRLYGDLKPLTDILTSCLCNVPQIQALAVNLSLIEELRAREIELTQLVVAKKAEEARGTEEAQLGRIRGEVEGLQRQVTTLRSERDR